jgi:hypothetical protein
MGCGLIATLAAMASPLASIKGRDPSHSAGLRYCPFILDFQVGIGDQPYAKSAAQRAAAALKAARAAGLPVVFSRVKFRAGYRDVADNHSLSAICTVASTSDLRESGRLTPFTT